MRISSLISSLMLALTLSAVTGPAAAQDDAEAKNLIVNGGFEEEAKGWQYHQWNGKKVPGTFDKDDKMEGKLSFKMHDEGGGNRYMAKEVIIEDSTKDHVITFYLMTQDVPDGAATVKVAIDKRGWLGSPKGRDVELRTGGTQKWKQYGIAVPASALGESKKITLFFNHEQVDKGTIGIDGVVVRVGAASELPKAVGPITLWGDTNEPQLSTFIAGQPVELRFGARGLEEGQELTLSVQVVDEHDKEVAKREVAVQGDAKGQWQGTMEAPADRLGFFRAHAQLSNGVKLESRGSRIAGFMTYAIVPDPANRKNYGEKESRFGMQGGFNGAWQDRSLSLLGARWVLDGSFEWRRNEPKRAGEYQEKLSTKPQEPAKQGSWQKYPLVTLFAAPKWACVPETFVYMTGTLTPEGEKAWADYCRLAAKAMMAKYPDLDKRIYQITWEPIQPWGYKGTDADLVRIYEIAYPILHETDPRAVVAGPCRGVNKNDVQRTTTLLKAGLGEYLDAYSTHPYFEVPPERDNMAGVLRAMRKALREHTGKDLPMLGTEQGWTTKEDPKLDLKHARGLLRQNLITLGEGYQFNFTYYIVDYRLSNQAGYGYYYNLDAGIPWAPTKLSPRPVAPAYAAQSLLLDGHDPVRAIEWLGDETWGYAFQRGDNVVLALWSYGDEPRRAALVTGVEEVTVYDWMGNTTRTPTPGGECTVTLTQDPIYITGVRADLWGRGGGQRLTLDQPQVVTTPGQSITIKASLAASKDQALEGDLVLDTDALVGQSRTQAVKIAPGKTQTVSFTIDLAKDLKTGRYPARVLLKQKGTTIDFAGMDMRLEPPILVTDVRPGVDAQGQATLVVLLKNLAPKTIAGELYVNLRRMYPELVESELPMIDLDRGRYRVEEQVRLAATQRFSLDAGAEGRIALAVDPQTVGTVDRLLADIEIRPDGQVAHRDRRPVNFLLAMRLPNGAAADAVFAQIKTLAEHRLSGKDHVIRSPKFYSGPADSSASLRMAWDDKALYLLVDVADDAFYQKWSDAESWRGDSLQLAFAVSRRDDPKAGFDADRPSELAVALTPQGPQVYRNMTFDVIGVPNGAIPESQAKATIRQTERGLEYAVVLSWASLGLERAPIAGQQLGIALTVNDADAADQKDPSALGLFGGITPSKDAEQFGVLLLAPAR
ncbi:MAG: sugar-binding protein [Phycisphaeraceae bacterium]